MYRVYAYVLRKYVSNSLNYKALATIKPSLERSNPLGCRRVEKLPVTRRAPVVVDTHPPDPRKRVRAQRDAAQPFLTIDQHAQGIVDRTAMERAGEWGGRWVCQIRVPHDRVARDPLRRVAIKETHPLLLLLVHEHIAS